MFRNRWLILGAIATAFVLVSADVQARVGGGFSGGSRGTRTFSAPPATPTAPSAAPIQRSITQPGTAAPIGELGTLDPRLDIGRRRVERLAAIDDDRALIVAELSLIHISEPTRH